MEMKIGENIRKVRELKGYSQDYMANQLGVSQRTYSSIENENNKIDAERLKTIAEILEVGILDILAFNENAFFNNHHCNQSSVGMFNTIHIDSSKEMEVYESRLEDMRQEIKHLREQMMFLQELVQSKFKS